MKKKSFDFVKFLGFLFVLFSAFLLTGCNGVLDSSADETETVSVSFGVDSSRGLHVDVVSDYEVGNLYWAYTATHESGLHYIGESETGGDAADTGINGTTAGGYKLRPVRRGAVKGLGIVDDKFSRGNWIFRLYGYTGYIESTGVFSGLVYTGTAVEGEVSLYTPSLYTPQFTDGFVAVNFLLTEFDGTGTGRTATAGKLVVAPLTFTIPEDMVLYSGKTLCAELADNSGSGSPVRKLYCEIPMTETLRAGEKVVLPFANVTGYNGTWETGSHDGEVLLSLTWRLWLKEAETAGSNTLASGEIYDIPIRAGASTFLYGDIDDVARQSTKPETVSFSNPACYTGTPGGSDYKEWTSVAEAINAGNTPVHLMRDVNNVGVVTKSATIMHHGYSASNIVSGVSGTGSCQICVSDTSNYSSSSAALRFVMYNGNIASFSVGGTEGTTGNYHTLFVDFWGSNGHVWTYNLVKNVYVTGCCDLFLTLGSSLTEAERNRKIGVHFYGDCATFEIRCNNNFIEFGPDTKINTFTCNGSSDGTYVGSVLEAHPTTVVGNLSLTWAYNDNSTVKGVTNSLLVPVTFDSNSESVYSGCVLSGHAGSSTGTKTIYWIKGIPINLTSTFLGGFQIYYCYGTSWKNAQGFKTFRDSEDGVPVSGTNYFTTSTPIPCNGPMTLYAYYSMCHLCVQRVYSLFVESEAKSAKFNTFVTMDPNSNRYRIYATFRVSNTIDGFRTLIGWNGSWSNPTSPNTSSSRVGIIFMASNNTTTSLYGYNDNTFKKVTFGGPGSAIVMAGNFAVPTLDARFGYNWREGIAFLFGKDQAGVSLDSSGFVNTTVGGYWNAAATIWVGGLYNTSSYCYVGDIGEIMINVVGTNNLLACFVPCVLRTNVASSYCGNGTASTKGTAGMWDFKTDKFFKSSTSYGFGYRKFKDGNVLNGVAY